MKFNKIATLLFLALRSADQAVEASTSPIRGEKRNLDEEYVHKASKSKGSKSTGGYEYEYEEYCGGYGEKCCDDLGCKPGLGCDLYDDYGSRKLSKYPTCKPCGHIGSPCCKNPCPKHGSCSLVCKPGAVCNFENQCEECGGPVGNWDRGDRSLTNGYQPCCVDSAGQSFCNEGYVCEAGMCKPCGSENGLCCVDSSGNQFCNNINPTKQQNCRNGKCERCGAAGVGGGFEPCCDSGVACPINAFCGSNNRCVFGAPQP